MVESTWCNDRDRKSTKVMWIKNNMINRSCFAIVDKNFMRNNIYNTLEIHNKKKKNAVREKYTQHSRRY